MNKKTRVNKYLIGFGILAMLAVCAIALFMNKQTETKSESIESIVKELAAKNVVFYYWTPDCPECDKEIALFGDNLKLLESHNCKEERDLCNKAGIQAVPSFRFGDKFYSGYYNVSEFRVIIDRENKAEIETASVDEFAKCLSDRYAKFYGAYWCSHCQNQKKLFGTSIAFVTYIECDDDGKEAQVCVDAGVTGYPTWIFHDGSKLEGTLTLEQLSDKTGCKVT